MEAIQMVMVPALQVEIPTASVTASTDDPYVGEECLQADLDVGAGEDASRVEPKAVMATSEVHRLREILPTASRVPGYSEKPIIQKRSSHI
jgi:hypothetical protein